MTKAYPELLAEWVKQRDSTRRDRNLVAFLAVRDDVKAAVDAGYAVRTIWTNMYDEKRVRFGYETFLNYVNRHIRRASREPAEAVANTAAVRAAVKNKRLQPEVERKEPRPPTKVPEGVPGFTFNAAPKMEDLI